MNGRGSLLPTREETLVVAPHPPLRLQDGRGTPHRGPLESLINAGGVVDVSFSFFLIHVQRAIAVKCDQLELACVIIMSHRNLARQHNVAEVACYRLDRTLMLCVKPPS